MVNNKQETTVVVRARDADLGDYDSSISWWEWGGPSWLLARAWKRGNEYVRTAVRTKTVALGWIVHHPFTAVGELAYGYLESLFYVPFQAAYELLAEGVKSPLLSLLVLWVVMVTFAMFRLAVAMEVQQIMTLIFGSGAIRGFAIPTSEAYVLNLFRWFGKREVLEYIESILFTRATYFEFAVLSQEVIDGIRGLVLPTIATNFAFARSIYRLWCIARERSLAKEVEQSEVQTLVFLEDDVKVVHMGAQVYKLMAYDSTGKYAFEVRPTAAQRFVKLITGRQVECAQPGSVVEPIEQPWNHTFALAETGGFIWGHGFRYGSDLVLPKHVWEKVVDRDDIVVVGPNRKTYPFKSKNWEVQIESEDEGADLVVVTPPSTVLTECGIRGAKILRNVRTTAVDIRRFGNGFRGEVSSGMYHPFERDDLFAVHEATTTGSVSGAPLTDKNGRIVGIHIGYEGSKNIALPAHIVAYLMDRHEETPTDSDGDGTRYEDDEGEVPEGAAGFKRRGKGGKSSSTYMHRRDKKYMVKQNAQRTKAFTRGGRKIYGDAGDADIAVGRSNEEVEDFQAARTAPPRRVQSGDAGRNSRKSGLANPIQTPNTGDGVAQVSRAEAAAPTGATDQTAAKPKSKSARRREKLLSKLAKATLSHPETSRPSGGASPTTAPSS